MDFYGVEQTGTTTLATVFDEGVVVAADSRTTMGAYIPSRCTDKLDPVHHRIFVLRAGTSAHTQNIARYVRSSLDQHAIVEGTLPQVSVAANMFQGFAYKYKNSINGSFVVAGWDEVQGGALYQITLGGSLLNQPFVMSGSGSTYIYGYCDANWRPNFNKEEAINFSKASVSLAMSRDGASGGVIRLAVITKDGVERIHVRADELPYKP